MQPFWDSYATFYKKKDFKGEARGAPAEQCVHPMPSCRDTMVDLSMPPLGRIDLSATPHHLLPPVVPAVDTKLIIDALAQEIRTNMLPSLTKAIKEDVMNSLHQAGVFPAKQPSQGSSVVVPPLLTSTGGPILPSSVAATNGLNPVIPSLSLGMLPLHTRITPLLFHRHHQVKSAINWEKCIRQIGWVALNPSVTK
jgi:hypothetical protein